MPMKNPKWGAYGETQCKIFDCNIVRKNLCCHDCRHKEHCENVCLNHPSRCRQSIPPIETKGKTKENTLEKKAKMVFQEAGCQWDSFDISRITGGKEL